MAKLKYLPSMVVARSLLSNSADTLKSVPKDVLECDDNVQWRLEMADIIDIKEYGWRDAPLGRLLSDYSPEERLERDLQCMVPFIEEMAHSHPDVLLSWMRTHPDSDFVQWLRTFENTGL
jgi:hypothetical protein